MLPCVCSVIDHRRRQNAVRTLVTHSAIASCATILFLQYCAKVMQAIIVEYRENRDISAIFNAN